MHGVSHAQQEESIVLLGRPNWTPPSVDRVLFGFVLKPLRPCVYLPLPCEVKLLRLESGLVFHVRPTNPTKRQIDTHTHTHNTHTHTKAKKMFTIEQ